MDRGTDPTNLTRHDFRETEGQCERSAGRIERSHERLEQLEAGIAEVLDLRPSSVWLEAMLRRHATLTMRHEALVEGHQANVRMLQAWRARTVPPVLAGL